MTSNTGWLHPSLESGREREATKSDASFKKSLAFLTFDRPPVYQQCVYCLCRQ